MVARRLRDCCRFSQYLSLLSKSFSFLVLSIYADHFHLSVSLDSSLSIFSLGGSYNPALIGGGGGSWLELDTSRGGVYWTHNNGAISIENIRKETLRKASGWRLPERSLDWRAGVSPEKGFVMDDLSTFQHKHTHTHTKSKARDREAAQHSSFLLYFSISLLFSVSLSLSSIFIRILKVYTIYIHVYYLKKKFRHQSGSSNKTIERRRVYLLGLFAIYSV